MDELEKKWVNLKAGNKYAISSSFKSLSIN